MSYVFTWRHTYEPPREPRNQTQKYLRSFSHFYFRFDALCARFSLVAHIHAITTLTHALAGPLCCVAVFARQHYTNSYIIFDFCIISLIYIEIESTKLRSAHICRSIFHFILRQRRRGNRVATKMHRLCARLHYFHATRCVRGWLRVDCTIRFVGGGRQSETIVFAMCSERNISSAWFILWAFVINIIHVAREMADIYLCSIINIFIVTITINAAYLAARCHSEHSTLTHTLTTNTTTKSKQRKRKNEKQKAVIAISDIRETMWILSSPARTNEIYLRQR